MSMRSIELVAFDLDDTLVCTASAVIKARKEALRVLSNGISMSEDDALQTWHRLSFYFRGTDRSTLLAAIQFELFKLINGEQIELASSTYQDCFWRIIAATDGAHELLSELISNRVRVGIVTNGISGHQLEKLRQTRLLHYFDVESVIIADRDSPMAKPRPDGLLSLVNSMGIHKDAAVYVGDRKADTIAAHLAGFAAAISFEGQSVESHEPGEAQTGLETPDFEVGALGEILGVIAKLSGTLR